jgi:predicted component of type VI protein secretion system
VIGTRLRIEVLDTETQVSQDYELEPRHEPLLVGRDRASDVVLPSASASRRHCEIESRPEGWFIRDLSLLGTLRNGIPLSKEEAQPLESGDTIECANFRLRVSISHPTDPTLKPDPDAIRRLFSEMEAPPPAPPRLWLFTEDSVSTHELSQDGSVLTIGRGSECDVRLADPHRVISAVHARVERNWAGVFLYDASRNGIFVNGNKVEERHALVDGDRITVAVPGEDPDRPLLVYAAEGSTREPSGPTRSAGASGVGMSAPASIVERSEEALADRFEPQEVREPVPASIRKGGWTDAIRDNLLIVLVLIVSGLALLTVLIWGLVLLRG